MTELHERFEGWLLDGAPGDPPRDLALHAWSCGECQALAVAVDDLAALDLDAATLPPVLAVPRAAPSRLGAAGRWAAAAASLGVVAVAISLTWNGWPRAAPGGAGGEDLPPSATAAEGVLGDVGRRTAPARMTPRPTPSADPTATATGPAAPTSVPTPVSGVGGAPLPGQPAPSSGPFPPGPPPPRTPRPSPTDGPPATTPAPTPRPTAAPTQPPPTPVPTPAPTQPLATPSPTPAPS